MEKERFSRLLPDEKLYNFFLLLIVAAFSVEPILHYVVIVLRKLPIISSFSGLFIPVLFAVLVFLNWKSPIIKNIRLTDLLLILMFYAVVLLSYLIYTDTRPYVEDQLMTMVAQVPLYFLLGLVFTSDKKTLDTLALLAKLIIVVDILFVIVYTSRGSELDEDSMARAYRMLPAVLWLIQQVFERKRVTDWIWAVFSVLYIITCGTRGPVMVVMAYLLYCMLFKQDRAWWKKCLSVASILAALYFYTTNLFNELVLLLMEWLEELGLSTRVFRYMMEDAMISDTSGRDVIYTRVLGLIQDSPLGYGILGEYAFLNWNTHNFYLQLLMHFGVVFGPLIIVAVVWLFCKAFHRNINPYARDTLAMWCCVTLVRGFFGGSYLTYYFPFFLGLCIREIRNKKTLYIPR